LQTYDEGRAMSDDRPDPWDTPQGPAWQPPLMPEDSRRMGLDRRVPEGAWIEFASMLDSRKKSHVAVAVVLLVVFMLPVLTTLKFVLETL
jgi:hypothetical protein